MKKLLIPILIIVLVYIGFSYLSDKKEEISIAPTTSRPDASNATFLFDGVSVTLKNGGNTGDAEDFIPTETLISGEPTYGDINDDGKNDAVIILTQESGGSGFFVYLAAYVSGNVTYKGSNAIFIGDRVSPQQISINSNGVITLDYLDRRPDEAMASVPTVQVSKNFVFRNGTLEER